ncbi:FkbM family methyltransferase [Paucihalobacter ruber]|uniref:FkbM family methyltransferase n=1 Tax=Paucihalobacter ruber TaxID=2567861 RepID=A0A506PK36_9FLAO|nr:FkbM family methyltransferase [Paucihalobacter ruber]TPV33868.1 FkbM family methyltransferase [Paucihalobacter ruber]
MRRSIRKLARNYGYDIIKFKKNQMGLYPFYDMAKFVKTKQPILFDIGANVGQTIKDFKEVFESSTIHAFEPSPDTFQILKNATSNFKNVYYWNVGVASQPGELMLNEYQLSNTNSFLESKTDNNAQLKKKTPVKIITIDQFCETHTIDKIDVLKIDTEGFELEVFKGTHNCFAAQKIGLLFFETTFNNHHDKAPRFTELCDFAIAQGFELVAFYPIVYRNNMAAYTNVLFKHMSYI